MASNTASVDRTRVRSSTWGSLQTLTRALRESLRLRKLRKQKRLRNEANEQMRGRSKSVGNEYIDDEISDIGISVAVASDIGPIINQAKMREAKILSKKMPKRRQSKSVDDVELAEIKKSIEQDRAQRQKISPGVATNGQAIRRRSKDDHDLPSKTSKIKDTHYYFAEQKGFRKRFGRLFGSLRNRQHQQLKPESPSPEGEVVEDKTETITNDKSNVQLNTTNEDQNNKKNNEVNRVETTVEDRE